MKHKDLNTAQNPPLQQTPVMRSIIQIRRKKKQIFIVNSWALGGGWRADATFIDLMLFGIRVKNLHRYYITHRGEYSDLRGVKYYS